MRTLVNRIFFLAGVYFIGCLVHELIHHFDCGGDFFAGFGWVKNELIIGITYCTREGVLGEYPTAIELLIDLYGLLQLRRIK